MADIDPELFNELMNSLQTAALLSRERVVEARAEAAAADQVHAAVARAVEAARRLRGDVDDRRS